MTAVCQGTIVRLWRTLLADPDCPDHLELSQLDEVIQWPGPTNRLQAILTFICERLRKQLGGRAFTRISTSTHGNGIRVTEVSWLPSKRYDDVLVVGRSRSVLPSSLKWNCQRLHLMFQEFGGI